MLSVMHQSVSIRRPLLVSGRYVLVNIILDMSLRTGSRQDRARTQSSIPSHTLLTTYRLWFWGCSEPPRTGATSAVVLGPAMAFYISITDLRRGVRLRGLRARRSCTIL